MAASSGFTPVSHVVFDMDGLLLDTERLYTKSTQMVASRFGKEYPFSLKIKAMGAIGRDAAQMMVTGMDLPLTVEEYMTETKALNEKLFPDAQIMPGVLRLVNHLHEHQIPIAIATSSDQRNFELKTVKHQDFIKKFHHVTLGNHVSRGKPNPDIFLVCIERFQPKPKPEQVLVFEDAPNGVQAAWAAGMQVVMIPDPRLDEEYRQKATQVLSSMDEFKPEEFGLPPFKE